ncbi:MAG: hypothetical protein V3V45_00525 [Candidatus Brocadiales bacterium]
MTVVGREAECDAGRCASWFEGCAIEAADECMAGAIKIIKG